MEAPDCCCSCRRCDPSYIEEIDLEKKAAYEAWASSPEGIITLKQRKECDEIWVQGMKKLNEVAHFEIDSWFER